MTTYYWEADSGSGQFRAKDDFEARRRRRSDCIVLYKENDTPNGDPFIIVWDNKMDENGRFLDEQ
ncbi:MAG: hypothetical protein M0R80_01210 [Proteobacteria bacterium]|jgi:hypothetical protein|nr:hypothetical protein [Pseudomonadota bacterium]